MQLNGLIQSAWIDDIYAAALGDQRWEAVLDGLRSSVGVRMATLLSFDDKARVPAIEQAAGDDASWVAACYHSYNTEFYLYDPVVPIAADWPTGRWFEDVKHLSAHQRAHSVFYQEFMHPFGLGSISGLYIHRGEGSGAFLSVQGGPESQGLSDDQRRMIEIMGAHISRALRIQARIGELEARVAAAESALDAIPVPVFLLGARRELRYTNRAADQLIAAEPALRVVNGRFAPEGCVDDAQWRHAFARGGLLLRRTTGEPLPLALIPVPEQSHLARERPGVTALMTAADLRSPSARAQRLRVFYGLSSAEADLAVLLCCDGRSPQECAALRGVSIGTVRAQIKSIYTKTDVARAAQLTSLVMQT
ncbi:MULTISPECIES: helix-turn-helix transcriptional regulator [Burkholderia]|uniref:Helix-turn-helix transcriptional regulator n=2 Tax=Burkholderia cepacia complex TaxID=87882 RepID=A0A8A8DFT0_9BURK|nr:MULTISPECIES: helix-turn-helix transcriptional regulator [Burkholderia]MBN3738250.1 helix-turn-helix transcriptional regulator [Burkholderia sp. Tr-20355]MCA8304735.1 helix-turn-helix transcriptional regulator [Burkholderia seminalis]MCA8425014.1 helix-turn-helix transcriptional regulator [Burkholderia seminalis]QTO23654.1 helix-turn-helix transcriptional regulator [Burkholderia seminalis]RQS78665.1 helix-turn-helix transcriptional regulator [Burkholderia seminalis]